MKNSEQKNKLSTIKNMFSNNYLTKFINKKKMERKNK